MLVRGILQIGELFCYVLVERVKDLLKPPGHVMMFKADCDTRNAYVRLLKVPTTRHHGVVFE